MSDIVQISQEPHGWQVELPGQAQFGYVRLADARRRAEQLIDRPGWSAVRWEYSDDFMQEAAELFKRRQAWKLEQAAIAEQTATVIQNLALQGLAIGDIAAAVGVTRERVGQLVDDLAEEMWGEGDPNQRLQFVRLILERGWKNIRGYGPPPPEITWAGRRFVPNGVASGAMGQPLRHSYVQQEQNGVAS
ncbi:hypothetical protein ACPPVW_18100 [Leifsonia sp. McL0607]|uniref:hypothetical protein n=1 Tax=Leifsonia sp. McL0607 TaxID=3415672 RepID=UPI003CF4ABA3